MNEFAKKFRKAYEAEYRYRDAPRRGWADPKGRKTADNQTIEVPREEAVNLAAGLASALYNSYHRLYEILALENYMDQIAEDEPDAMVCPTCFFHYLPGWVGGNCPYCAAAVAAVEKMRELMGESEENRPVSGAAGEEGT